MIYYFNQFQYVNELYSNYINTSFGIHVTLNGGG
jgi:hypothetical protein